MLKESIVKFDSKFGNTDINCRIQIRILLKAGIMDMSSAGLSSSWTFEFGRIHLLISYISLLFSMTEDTNKETEKK